MREESADTTAMMTVGSVRGKLRFETPEREAQAGRFGAGAAATVLAVGVAGRRARSVGGQVRLVPAWTERVGCPHCAQKGLRAFQSRRARACA